MDYDQNDLNEISGAYNAKVGLMQSSGHKANKITGTSLADQLKIKKESKTKETFQASKNQTINMQTEKILQSSNKLNFVGMVAIIVIIGVVVFFLLR